MPGVEPIVLYLLDEFPKLSETFVLREMLEMERQGVALGVVSLQRPGPGRQHPAVRHLKAQVRYAPDGVPALSAAHARFALRRPRTHHQALAFAALRVLRGDLSMRTVWLAGFAAQAALDLRAGLIHAHFATRPGQVAMLASLMACIPYSVTAHARDLFVGKPATQPRAMADLIGRAAAVITVSSYNVRHLEAVCPAAAGRIHRLPMGVPLDQFPYRERSPVQPCRILAVGRLVEKKGFDVLVRACGLLVGRGLDFHCDIVGEGPMRPQLEAIVAHEKLGDRVRLLGARTEDELRGLFDRAGLFALPCRIAPDGDRDGLPVVLFEAMAAGVPVVSTGVVGIPELIEDGRTGLLVPECDAERLAGAIWRLAHDADLAERLRRAAREKAESELDLSANVARMRALLGLTPTPAGERASPA